MMADNHTGRASVVLLIGLTLIGCGSTTPLAGDPAGWSDTLQSGDRVTVVEATGERVDVRVERLKDGMLYGTRDDESAYAVSLDQIETLELEDAGDRGTGKTLAAIGLVILGVALIDALQDIPPGWPAYR